MLLEQKYFKRRELLLKAMAATLEQCVLGLRSKVKHTPKSLIDNMDCKGIPESE